MGCIRNTLMIRIDLILLNRIRNLIGIFNGIVIVCPVQVIWLAIRTFGTGAGKQTTYQQSNKNLFHNYNSPHSAATILPAINTTFY